MKRIGFIGLGIMGKPMARNLLRAGYPLVVHNRSREPVKELVSEGAEEAFSPKEVAQRSDVVITMLPDSPDVEKVILGENGVIEGVREGMTVIDMSTISPVVTRRIAEKLREKGVEMLDAPVSGGEEGAINATLSIMVGGKKEVFEKHRDIFETLGRNVVHVGENGAGQIAKACNQIIVAGTLEIVSEALMLASKAGVDPEKVVKAITGGAADCWALRARAPKMLKHDFKPGFKSSYHLKDLRIAVSTASEYGAVLPVTHMLHEMFKSMVQKKRGDYDHSGIATIIEDLSGHKIS